MELPPGRIQQLNTYYQCILVWCCSSPYTYRLCGRLHGSPNSCQHSALWNLLLSAPLRMEKQCQWCFNLNFSFYEWGWVPSRFKSQLYFVFHDLIISFTHFSIVFFVIFLLIWWRLYSKEISPLLMIWSIFSIFICFLTLLTTFLRYDWLTINCLYL